MGMSVAGIVFDGYFFAFHLLNIVNNNQLLRGVIQAVTQNGLYTHHFFFFFFFFFFCEKFVNLYLNVSFLNTI